MTRKGIRLIFLNQDGEIVLWFNFGWTIAHWRQRKQARRRRRQNGEELSFLSKFTVVIDESLESIHSKIGDQVNVKSYGSSMIPISVDGP